MAEERKVSESLTGQLPNDKEKIDAMARQKLTTIFSNRYKLPPEEIEKMVDDFWKKSKPTPEKVEGFLRDVSMDITDFMIGLFNWVKKKGGDIAEYLQSPVIKEYPKEETNLADTYIQEEYKPKKKGGFLREVFKTPYGVPFWEVKKVKAGENK